MGTRPASALRKVLVGSLVILCVVGFLFIIRFFLREFTIKNIYVSGDAAIVEVNEKQFVGNTLLFPSMSVIKQIQEDNPLIKSIDIKKHFPSTLELIVHKRQPIARLKTATAIVGIDEDAVITDVIGEANAPVIEIDVPLVRMGQTIRDDFVKQAVAVIVGSAQFLVINKVTKNDSLSLRVQTPQSDIFITQKGDIRPTLDTLQTLMSGFRIKGLIPKTIDLRFDKPVVQF